MANLPTYKIEEIKNINEQLIRVFDDAAKINPNDPELLVFYMLFSLDWPFSFSLSANTMFPSIYSIEHSISTPRTTFL
jgi:hypothetical protein